MSTCEATESLCNDTKRKKNESKTPNDSQLQQSIVITTVDKKYADGVLIKVPFFADREKRNVSPPTCFLNEVFVDPQSPSSSSSHATSTNDATFEPTIEMMVNDFDDEQTLNEEEALASLETQDPDEEIDTLKKEGEMPLEELLAKYRTLPPSNFCSEPIQKIQKKSSNKEKQKQKRIQEGHTNQTCNKSIEETLNSHQGVDTFKNPKPNVEYCNAESINESGLLDDENTDGYMDKNSIRISTLRKPFTSSIDAEQNEAIDNSIIQNEIPKVRRSHLLDLYPEGTFDNAVVVNDTRVGNSKETIYGVEDDEEYEEIEEEEDEDYKKKVMIGTSYQATIPMGLSQYGDILPYENEDKLIWEPCQVSEREVEEYLVKIRDIKSNQQGEEFEHTATDTSSETPSKENGILEKNIYNMENNSFLANGDTLLVETTSSVEMDNLAVVKDNEQALHLLVQCGYDFKEALRRKRLNALPLNDCMSLWSEEECHKFEEGIQKYGKDFLKIRQNQVRTRTMRELVQFYYLWKKSERRDQNFANADTVDHMDIYLNEDNEYGSNTASVLTPSGSPVNTWICTGIGKNNSTSHKNISIMTTTSTTTVVANLNSEKNGSKSCFQQHQTHHKRRTHVSNQSTHNITATDSINEHSCNTLINSSK